MTKNIAWLIAFSSCLTQLTTASAANIPVPNFSFENPSVSGSNGGVNGNTTAVTDWTIGVSGAGVDDGAGVQTGAFAVIPDGVQTAYFNSNISGDIVSLTLTPGTNTLPTVVGGDAYTLTVAVAHRDTVPAGTVTIQLLANGVSVASNSVVFTGTMGGTFNDLSATLTAAESASLAGEQLSINLFDTNTDNAFSQAGVDDVRLTVVPEPSSVVLLGLSAVGLLLSARRRSKA